MDYENIEKISNNDLGVICIEKCPLTDKQKLYA